VGRNNLFTTEPLHNFNSHLLFSPPNLVNSKYRSLEYDYNEQGGWMWRELIWFRLGKVTGFCEYINEPLRPIKGRKFIQ